MTEPANDTDSSAADDALDLQPSANPDEVAEADEDDARNPDDLDDAVDDNL